MMRAACDNTATISGCYYLQLWQGGGAWAGHQVGAGLIVLTGVPASSILDSSHFDGTSCQCTCVPDL